MPPVKLDMLVDDGDMIELGSLKIEVWHTPGHTDSQLSFRLGNLLLSGDNIYRDGCVGRSTPIMAATFRPSFVR